MSQSTQRTDTVGRRPSIPYAAIGRRGGPPNPTIEAGCPCCGAPITATKPFVDPNTNKLVYGHNSIHLGKIQARLMDILCRRAPGVVDRDSLIMHAWQDDEPEEAHQILQVTLSQIRKKLDMIGLNLVNVYDVGYRVAIS